MRENKSFLSQGMEIHKHFTVAISDNMASKWEKGFFYWVWEWRSILSYFSSSEDMVTKWMKKILNWVRDGYPQLSFICKQWGNGNHMRENNSFWVGEWISTTIFQWQSVIIWPQNERKIFLLSMGMEIHPQLLFKQWGYGNQMNEKNS